MANKVLQLIKESGAKWVDFRFTDTKGKEQHVTYPADTIDEDTFEDGKMFDGSSIAGWKGIEASDMILRPDAETGFLDPFFAEPTVVVTCDVIEPSTGQGYERDPRSIARRAEEYLKSTGIGDTAFFGPEPEFFVFDEVKWDIDMSGARHTLIAEEAAWSTGKDYEAGNSGHRPRVKGGYFPVPPVDSHQDMRAEMCARIEDIMGPGRVEVHHHEVASCQLEIGVSFNTLVRKADEVQQFKYAVWNVAHQYGKTATFMPKPMVGDNGSGMHVHMSISKDGKNLFNVSTASSFVIAAAGATIAKHGNRGVSSKSGSSDVLEQMGIQLDLDMQQTERCIREMGVGFLFAPNHHKAMRYAVAPRRELGIRSIFNLLGPLTNPAGVNRFVIGVFSDELCLPIAEVLKQLGAVHVMVVHSRDGLDEISLAAPTTVAELKDGEITEWTITPDEVGIPSQTLTGLVVNSSQESLQLIKDALGRNKSEIGEKAANMIALNAGAGIYVAGMTKTYKQAVALAQDILYGGQALEKMSILGEFTKTLKQYQAD